MESELWGRDIEENERAARFCVWANRAVNAAGFEALLTSTQGCIEQIWDRKELEKLEISDVSRQRLHNIVGMDYRMQWNAQLAQLPAGVTLLHRGDHDYPGRFLSLSDPPIFLYVWGDVKNLHFGRKVAMVGSRAADLRMREFAETMAISLSEQQVAVISGGALGVDSCAHRGSLQVGGTTLAFLPGALDRLAPSRHRELFEKIAQTGAVISEYPPGVSARPFHFARRNRLIAALSDAVVVIRAEFDSGTMITARAAIELGRPVCAVPGALDDPFSEGCLQLLVDGAFAVRNASDVVYQIYENELRSESNHAPRRRNRRLQSESSKNGGRNTDSAPAQVNLPLDLSGLALDKQQVLTALDELGRSTNQREILVDELARYLQWNVVQVSTVLIELELYQRISKVAGSNAYRLSGR